ncbi:MAG: DNA transformation protein [Planctomycetota bacterium]|jgi:DNA transformation protein
MDETLDYVLEQLAGLGELSARKMFGGVGLYCDGLFFALIGRGTLYMKVDDSNRAMYEAKDCEAFRPDPDKPQSMNYYELPVDVLERPDLAREWAQPSVEIARAAKKGKKASSKAAGKMSAKRAKMSAASSLTGPEEQPSGQSTRRTCSGDSASVPITALRNLGKASAEWVKEIGILTRADLESMGSVATFRAVERNRGKVSLNLLYALEGALLDIHWTRLPAPLKEQLRSALRD